MRIDLRDLIAKPGEKLVITDQFDITDMEFSYQYPATKPLAVSGVVRNTAGILELETDVTAHLHWECDRCLSPYDEVKTMHISAVLAESTENPDNEDIFLLDNGELELGDIILPEFALDMDSKHLCRPDCQGLCPVCGKDLNEGSCDCVVKEIDPRMAALQQFLDK